MNLKRAKLLRRVARIATRVGSLRDDLTYERHAVRGIVRVSPTCPRGLYHALKKGTS